MYGSTCAASQSCQSNHCKRDWTNLRAHLPHSLYCGPRQLQLNLAAKHPNNCNINKREQKQIKQMKQTHKPPFRMSSSTCSPSLPPSTAECITLHLNTRCSHSNHGCPSAVLIHNDKQREKKWCCNQFAVRRGGGYLSGQGSFIIGKGYSEMEGCSA